MSDDKNNIVKKTHWENYEVYYLVFGGFFLTIFLIFISNHSTSNQIRKVEKQLNDSLLELYDLAQNESGKKNNNHGGQVSKFETPDLSRKNKNWINDIIIQKDVNEAVKKWINTFKFLPRYQTKQKLELDNHVLFCGPPGSGKSFIIEEFCHNETSGFTLAHFETQIYVGSSIEKQQKVFKNAKELLEINAIKKETKPVAIVIEEIDSVGRKDLSGNNTSNNVEVDGLLKIFDEINKNNLNIIIIGTTNNPEVLNEALVRPGRLGRRIQVNYPSSEELKKLVNYCQKFTEKNWKSFFNEQEWKDKDKDKDKDKIVEWPSDYWSNVYQSIQEIGAEFHEKETGFNFRDLQKAITTSLADKVEENNSKIVPDIQVFKKDLWATLQTRIDDQEKNLQNRWHLPRQEFDQYPWKEKKFPKQKKPYKY